jgi:aminoglycoside phosphotransferase (APT) family kinase protein
MHATTVRRRGLRNEDQLVRLADWLHRELLPTWQGARFASLTRTSGGVSYETWIVDLEDPSAPDEHRVRLVVRREPLRGPLEPYDVADEAAVYVGLAGTGVPVPRLLATCSDTSVADRRFSVLEFIEGDVPDYRTIMSRPDWIDERRRRGMAGEFVRVLAEVQRVDPQRLPPVAAAPVPRSERERLHGLIDAMLESAGRRMATWVAHPIFRDVARWCREHAPDGGPEDMVVVHGDYKVGNFLWRDDRIVALLDWEGAMLGDPLQDLGYACHPAMREPRPELMAMLAPIDELLALYEGFTGRSVDRRRLHYYVIYALLFHTWTLMIGLPSIVEWDGDLRMATGYAKLNQVTRLVVAQIEAYEEGRGVL